MFLAEFATSPLTPAETFENNIEAQHRMSSISLGDDQEQELDEE